LNVLFHKTAKNKKTASEDNVIKFTNTDMSTAQSGSILKKVESDFYLHFCNNFLSTNLPTAKPWTAYEPEYYDPTSGF
jgi:hypothetical protein